MSYTKGTRTSIIGIVMPHDRCQTSAQWPDLPRIEVAQNGNLAQGVERVFENGKRLVILPVGPDDTQLVSSAFESLSEETRYCRCFMSKKALSPAELTLLCNNDGIDNLLLGVRSASSPIEGIGAASFNRLKPGGRHAELAFVVVDHWQGSGVAQWMLQHLFAAAWSVGIDTLQAEMLDHNVRAKQLLRKLCDQLGLDYSSTPEGGTVRLYHSEMVVQAIDQIQHKRIA